MKKLYSIVIALLFITQLGLNAQTLLAEYPLVEDGVDATGKNTDMTISKASFQNDGIYSNGIYYGSDTTGSYISTPQIEGFNFDDLTIKVDFFIDDVFQFKADQLAVTEGSLGVFGRSAGDSVLTINYSDLQVWSLKD